MPDGSNERRLISYWLNASQPAWSPNGARIAFVAGGNIWVGNADGSGLVDLRQSGLTPTWSPDGSRLAFANLDGNDWEIYTIRANGTELKQLTNNTWDDTDLDWWP